MNFYDKYVLPRLINLSVQNKAAMAERARFVPLVSGTVLEVGIGSGVNIPFYGRGIERLCGVDPSLELWRLARRRAAHAPFPIEFVNSSGEELPMEDQAFDTVVTTWTLCTIESPLRALGEMRRVLKREGRLIFIEHGRSPDAGVLAWQDRLTPLWRRISGGCHLNRKMDDLIRDAGFEITRLETGYVRGPRPMAYFYRGLARRSDEDLSRNTPPDPQLDE